MLDSIRTQLRECFCDGGAQVRSTKILAVQVLQRIVRDIVHILFCSEAPELKSDAPQIGRSDTAVINLRSGALQNVEQTDRLEVACHADVLGNQKDALDPGMANQQRVD
jgi:hypothetical protein